MLLYQGNYNINLPAVPGNGMLCFFSHQIPCLKNTLTLVLNRGSNQS